ncbi:hypothetical protein GQ53DRAFT_332471 [Thozetella sp. PMI_491]|nr:hypothetical protein GQ53DRAFT_332471 [Thozetella sp. PMI_491]
MARLRTGQEYGDVLRGRLSRLCGQWAVGSCEEGEHHEVRASEARQGSRVELFQPCQPWRGGIGMGAGNGVKTGTQLMGPSAWSLLKKRGHRREKAGGPLPPPPSRKANGNRAIPPGRFTHSRCTLARPHLQRTQCVFKQRHEKKKKKEKRGGPCPCVASTS